MQPANPRMNITPPTTRKSQTGSKPPRSVMDEMLERTPWRGGSRGQQEVVRKIIQTHTVHSSHHRWADLFLLSNGISLVHFYSISSILAPQKPIHSHAYFSLWMDENVIHNRAGNPGNCPPPPRATWHPFYLFLFLGPCLSFTVLSEWRCKWSEISLCAELNQLQHNASVPPGEGFVKFGSNSKMMWSDFRGWTPKGEVKVMSCLQEFY